MGFSPGDSGVRPSTQVKNLSNTSLKLGLFSTVFYTVERDMNFRKLVKDKIYLSDASQFGARTCNEPKNRLGIGVKLGNLD